MLYGVLSRTSIKVKPFSVFLMLRYFYRKDSYALFSILLYVLQS
uniref:Uncharacterized protein n=1 Tax=Anguilla anguilla TaxID=7936 RepID=A0A0E9S1B1_ANGAN